MQDELNSREKEVVEEFSALVIPERRAICHVQI